MSTQASKQEYIEHLQEITPRQKNGRRARRGTPCRLFGVDFISVAAAARYWDISIPYAQEMVSAGRHRDTPRDDIRKNWKEGTHGYKGED